MLPPTLSEKLLASVSRDFFGPLTRPSAAIYVNCAERLADIAGEAGRIHHTEVIALIREILSAHPEIVLEDDEGASMRDARQRAGQIFNRLCDAKWLEDQQLIMAFPEDRMPTMIQHAETVVQCRVERSDDEKTVRSASSADWVLLVGWCFRAYFVLVG